MWLINANSFRKSNFPYWKYIVTMVLIIFNNFNNLTIWIKNLLVLWQDAFDILAIFHIENVRLNIIIKVYPINLTIKSDSRIQLLLNPKWVQMISPGAIMNKEPSILTMELQKLAENREWDGSKCSRLGLMKIIASAILKSYFKTTCTRRRDHWWRGIRGRGCFAQPPLQKIHALKNWHLCCWNESLSG